LPLLARTFGLAKNNAAEAQQACEPVAVIGFRAEEREEDA